ncbi:MAG TPA: O-antigen ligase family protein [Candidatus Limnocylindria bacterium]|nr:O-antigen ligase family protein [Candidatus Limnocylindria bacterium]
MAKGKKRPSETAREEQIASDPLMWVARAVVLLKVVLVLLVFDPTASDAFSLPKSSVSHALTYALSATLVVLFIRHGRALLFPSPIFAAAAAVLVVFVLATVTATDTTVALFGTWRRYLGLTQVLDNFILLVAVALTSRALVDRALLLAMGLGTVAVVAFYSFAQRLGIDFVRYREAAHPVISTLGQPDILGAFAAVATVTALAAAVILWDRIGPPRRAALLAIGAAALAVCVLTGVRAGALGLAAGWAATVVLLLLWPRTPWRRTALWVVLGAGLLLVAVVALSPIGARLTPAALAGDLGIRSRLDIWDTAWRIVAAHPLLGAGPDNFANLYPAFRDEASALLRTGELQNSTHSWFWYAATSAGALGAVTMLVFAAVVLGYGVLLAGRGRLEALALVPVAAYLGQGIVGVNDVSLDWVLWLSAGVIAGASGSLSRPDPVPQPVRLAPSAGLVAAGLIVLVAAAVGVVGITGRVGASRVLGQAQALVDAGAGGPAIPLARAVVTFDPRRPEHWSNYGAALSAAGADPAAVEAFRVATRLDPSYPNHWRNLAIELGRLGNIPGAYLAAQRAVVADAWDPDSLDLLAQLALSRGDAEQAAAAGTEAVKLDPAHLSRYDAPVFADLSLGRFADAERLLAQAFENGGENSSLLRYRRAQLYAATNRKALALEELDAALRLDPKNADAAKLKQDLTK